MSVMAFCAATPRICDRPNDVIACTTVASPTAHASVGSSSSRCLPMTSSIRYLDGDRQREPGDAADEHQHEPERQAPRAAPRSARALPPRRRTSGSSSWEPSGRPRLTRVPIRSVIVQPHALLAPVGACLTSCPRTRDEPRAHGRDGRDRAGVAVAKHDDAELGRGDGQSGRRDSPAVDPPCPSMTTSPRRGAS